MVSTSRTRQRSLCLGIVAWTCLTACLGPSDPSSQQYPGFEVRLLFGSALDDFCVHAIERFNQQGPKLQSGAAFYATCEAKGSGDVVSTTLDLAERLRNGQIAVDSPEFPTLLSVDGEIYQSQLIFQMDQLFPGQDYIPAITDSPLLVHSPMILMTTPDLAPGLEQTADIYTALVTSDSHQDLDPAAPPYPISFVHTAPTRSNSGLQTLVAQFASVAGKRPEELTLADVAQYENEVSQIQEKITRYGVSTSSLARSMVQNGPFWASVGSVYESLVIRANSDQSAQEYVAVYPEATFSSNMRGILPTAPWVSAEEREAADQIIAFLREPDTQVVALEEGLRPGVAGVELGPKFSPEFGVEPQPQYDSYRPPQPEVVEAMLRSWEEVAKKASLVVIVVDSSGSMRGEKIAAVQQTLKTYVDDLGPKEQIALIDFDSQIREPVLIEGTPEGQQRAFQFISQLGAGGGTALYDAISASSNWLESNLRPNAINAVLVLTDGIDSGSQTSLSVLNAQLAESGFESDARIGVFTVGYGEDREFDPSVLTQIAAENGGYYSKGDPGSIAEVMSRLQLEF